MKVKKDSALNTPNFILAEEDWKDLLAWGAQDKQQKIFDVLATIFVYQQRLPVDANKAADYGGVENYLLSCEAEGNVVRFLKSLKAQKEFAGEQERKKQESVNE